VSQRLLSIIELGGYPNLIPLYQSMGFDVDMVTSQRKARTYLKKMIPNVIVAEYNFQSDFRDRTSNLETLVAVLQKHPQVKLIVFYMHEHEAKFEQFCTQSNVFESISYPVSEGVVRGALQRALEAD